MAFDEVAFEDVEEDEFGRWTDDWAWHDAELGEAGLLVDCWYSAWPDADIVETWSIYERRWVNWERDNDDWWEWHGLNDQPPAAWEPGFRKWVAGFRPSSCVHCGQAPPSYDEGSCRTCYRWLLRNRERFAPKDLYRELARVVGRRRPKAERVSDRASV